MVFRITEVVDGGRTEDHRRSCAEAARKMNKAAFIVDMPCRMSQQAAGLPQVYLADVVVIDTGNRRACSRPDLNDGKIRAFRLKQANDLSKMRITFRRRRAHDDHAEVEAIMDRNKAAAGKAERRNDVFVSFRQEAIIAWLYSREGVQQIPSLQIHIDGLAREKIVPARMMLNKRLKLRCEFTDVLDSVTELLVPPQLAPSYEFRIHDDKMHHPQCEIVFRSQLVKKKLRIGVTEPGYRRENPSSNVRVAGVQVKRERLGLIGKVSQVPRGNDIVAEPAGNFYG